MFSPQAHAANIARIKALPIQARQAEFTRTFGKLPPQDRLALAHLLLSPDISPERAARRAKEVPTGEASPTMQLFLERAATMDESTWQSLAPTLRNMLVTIDPTLRQPKPAAASSSNYASEAATLRRRVEELDQAGRYSEATAIHSRVIALEMADRFGRSPGADPSVADRREPPEMEPA